MKKYNYFFLFVSLWLVTACTDSSGVKVKPIVLVTQPDQVNDEVAKLIETQLMDWDTLKVLLVSDDSLYATKEIIKLYETTDFDPLWTDKGRPRRQLDSLLELIKHSTDYGLIPRDYHFDKIRQLMVPERNTVSIKYDAVKISEIDLLLTDALFMLAVHINKGRLNPENLQRQWNSDKIDSNLVDVLRDAIKRNSIRKVIDSIQPSNNQYKALKLALAQFKIEFKDSDWDSLFKSGSDTNTFNFRLKYRLIAGHHYTNDPGVSESTNLTNAIKDLQCRHNLTEDGIIGPLTYKLLQQTKQDYIRKIEMNMERWRYQDPPREDKWVWINIPKYEMSVFEDDTLVMRSRVIVGAVKTPTPLLKSSIRYFIIYPYWTVPYSIATKEILPKLKRDPSYLHRENFEVLDKHKHLITTPIKWGKYNEKYFPFYLRQRIGEDNSLGILKFDFTNRYGVYLHDTNNHKLFNKDMRAISHGCIRLESSVDFAKYLIRDDSIRYPVNTFMFDLFKEEQKYVYLKRPIPIYTNYFTVELDQYGQLFYFMDVYKLDEKMLKALYRK